MNLSAADQARFPRATAYIKNSLPQVVHVPSIRRAIALTAQLNRAQLQQALRWGSSPDITIVAGMGNCGEYVPTPGNNVLRIQERLFTEFEAGRGRAVARGGRVYVLGVTILHELVHWGDNRDGVDRAGEEGAEFERIVYGSVIPC